MLKLLITDFRKEYLYGDCHLEEDGHWFPLIGGKIEVKLLGLIWVNYTVFYYKNR
jgi:hypothetical protein